jgi:serine/threonine protein kinase
MAPEQFQGRPRRASDQYALGIVVYEWLSGDVPFHGSFLQVAIQHRLTPPPPFREKGFILLPAVEQVVMRALAKEPKERFASVQEFAQTLVTTLQQVIQMASEPTVKDEPPAFVVPPDIKATPKRKPSPASLKTKEQWFIKGSTHQSARQYREAIAAYSLALELDSMYALAYAKRGQVYSLLMDYSRAVKDFDRALTLDPSLAWVKPDREYAYHQLNQDR